VINILEDIPIYSDLHSASAQFYYTLRNTKRYT
jgi:hypothetical protein